MKCESCGKDGTLDIRATFSMVAIWSQTTTTGEENFQWIATASRKNSTRKPSLPPVYEATNV